MIYFKDKFEHLKKVKRKDKVKSSKKKIRKCKEEQIRDVDKNCI